MIPRHVEQLHRARVRRALQLSRRAAERGARVQRLVILRGES